MLAKGWGWEMAVLQVLATLAVALAGALGARRLRVPGGAILGAIALVAGYNVMTGLAMMPAWLKVIAQCVCGVFIGARIRRADLAHIRRIALPVLLTVIGMIACCLLMGLALSALAGIDRRAALLACAPGGVTEMALIGADIGADVPFISVSHIVRLAVVVSVFPVLLKAVLRRLMRRGRVSRAENVAEAAPAPRPAAPQSPWLLARTLLLGLAAGLLGWRLGVPAGAMLFSMVATAALNIVRGDVYVPMGFRLGAQACTGALVGASITGAALLQVAASLLPICLVLVGFFVINLFLAYLLVRIGHLDTATAMFCTTPGGATEMSLLAGEYGANLPVVSTIQILRSIAVVALYPWLVSLF